MSNTLEQYRTVWDRGNEVPAFCTTGPRCDLLEALWPHKFMTTPGNFSQHCCPTDMEVETQLRISLYPSGLSPLLVIPHFQDMLLEAEMGGPCPNPFAQNPSLGTCSLSPAHAFPDLSPHAEAGGDAEPHSQDTGTEVSHFRHFSKADKNSRERLFAGSNPRQRSHSRKVLSHCWT